MSSPKKGRGYGSFLAKTITITVLDALVAFWITSVYIYASFAPVFNGIAPLFPQPITISGFALAYFAVGAIIFVGISLVLFRLGYRKA